MYSPGRRQNNRQETKTERISQSLSDMPTVDQITLGQQAIALYCAEMMAFAASTQNGALYTYYRRISALISDEELFMYIAPLIFRADKIMDAHFRHQQFVEQNTNIMRTDTVSVQSMRRS